MTKLTFDDFTNIVTISVRNKELANINYRLFLNLINNKFLNFINIKRS
jgi:hypothetical protein